MMNVEIERHFDAERLNEIVNHPDVLPWIGHNPSEPLDLTRIISDVSNYLLLGEHGGILFYRLQPGLYEAHTQVLPEGRGKWTVAMTWAALRFMFTQTDCVEVVSKAPEGNKGALGLIRLAHGVYQFTSQAGWIVDGAPVPARIYSWTIQHWIKTAPDLIDRGNRFLTQLNNEMERHGVITRSEITDEIARQFGAVVEMALGPLPKKGELFYNRFAAMSDRSPAIIVSTDPLTLEFPECMLILTKNTVTMPYCRIS